MDQQEIRKCYWISNGACLPAIDWALPLASVDPVKVVTVNTVLFIFWLRVLSVKFRRAMWWEQSDGLQFPNPASLFMFM